MKHPFFFNEKQKKNQEEESKSEFFMDPEGENALVPDAPCKNEELSINR